MGKVIIARLHFQQKAPINIIYIYSKTLHRDRLNSTTTL